jgi:hypothetical protein
MAEEIVAAGGTSLLRIPYEAWHDTIDYIVPPDWEPGKPQWLRVGREGNFTVVMP